MKYKISRLPELTLLSIFCLQAKSAEQIPCEIAVPLITPAYKRTAEASNIKDLIAAHHYKKAFWDFFEYGKHCKSVNTMAKYLKEGKLDIGDNPPLPNPLPNIEVAGITKLTPPAPTPIKIDITGLERDDEVLTGEVSATAVPGKAPVFGNSQHEAIDINNVHNGRFDVNNLRNGTIDFYKLHQMHNSKQP